MIWKFLHKRVYSSRFLDSSHGRSIDTFRRYFSLIVAIHLSPPQTNSREFSSSTEKLYREKGKEKEGEGKKDGDRIDWNRMKLLISISAIFKCFSKLPYRTEFALHLHFMRPGKVYRDYTVTYEVITEFWKRKNAKGNATFVRSYSRLETLYTNRYIGIILKYFSTREKYTFS